MTRTCDRCGHYDDVDYYAYDDMDHEERWCDNCYFAWCSDGKPSEYDAYMMSMGYKRDDNGEWV